MSPFHVFVFSSLKGVVEQFRGLSREYSLEVVWVEHIIMCRWGQVRKYQIQRRERTWIRAELEDARKQTGSGNEDPSTEL